MLSLLVCLSILLEGKCFLLPKKEHFQTSKIVNKNICFNHVAIDLKVESEINPNQTNISVGIDLGTTYSLISVVGPINDTINDSFPRIIPVDGHRMLPSVVSYHCNEKIRIGYDAMIDDEEEPVNSYSSVKRIIGKTFQEVKGKLGKSLDLKIVDSKRNVTQLCELYCPALKSNISPENISSEIIKKLLKSAREYLDNEFYIDKAVITVPAYFRYNYKICEIIFKL